MRTMTRRGFSAMMAVLMATVLSMAIAVPAFAADATSGSIAECPTEMTVTAGSTVSLSTNVKEGAVNPPDSDYHFDYVVTQGDKVVATVSKHSGQLVALSEGQATVTVYLMSGPTPDKNSGKPCTGRTILDQEDITINVTATSTYGYQGTGGNAIMMTSPSVLSTALVNGEYVNEIDHSTLVSSGNRYLFTYQQTNGFRSYDGAAAYATRNAGNISLVDANGQTVGILGDGTGAVSIESATHATKTIVVSVDAETIESGGKLVFGSELCGNSDDNDLGCTVSFS